jgi:LDH2 family malate/lactate/ureidoglycolate dehydrogenase
MATLHADPRSAIRVQAAELRSFAQQLLLPLGLPAADAELIARTLVEIDLRGVFSHGTRRLATYVGQYQRGELNPGPQICLERDTEVITVVNGDGGLGYLAALEGTPSLVRKALAHGLAATCTRNHGHAGSLGVYARQAIDAGLVFFATAGGRDWHPPERQDATIWDAMQSPPLCLAVPAAAGPPLVVDMSANFFRSGALGEAAHCCREALLKSLGLKFAATLMGGMLGGAVERQETDPRYVAATRGALMWALAPAAVTDAAAFAGEVQRVIDASLELAPIPGESRAELAGSLEWKRERHWAQHGVPLGPEHQEVLSRLGHELDVPLPWSGRPSEPYAALDVG